MLSKFLGGLKRSIEADDEPERRIRALPATSEVKRLSLELQSHNGSLLSTQNPIARGINAVASIAYNQLGSTYTAPVTAESGSNVHLGNVTNIYNGGCAHDLSTEDEEDEKTLRDWAHKLQHEHMLRRHHELHNVAVAAGTCQWLFETQEFADWDTAAVQDDVLPTLVLEGKPGSGKSILVKTAFQRSLAGDALEKQLTLGFFFNARDVVPLGRSSQGFFRSILSQLLEKLQPTSEVVDIVKQLRSPRDGEWDVHMLKHTVTQLLNCTRGQRTVLFLDALNECRNDEDDPDAIDILDFINGLSDTGTNLRVCISTRSTVDFGANLLSTSVVDVKQHNEADIRRYLDEQLKRVRLRPEFRQKLTTVLCRRAANMFLWVRLVVIRIKMRARASEREILQEVEATPTKLHDLFGTLLDNAARKRCDESLALFHLTQVAVRPLTLSELRSALGRLSSSGKLDGMHRASELPAFADSDSLQEAISEELERLRVDEELQFADRIHALSGGLLEVSSSPTSPVRHEKPNPGHRNVVQFIHQSVREFLRDGGLGTLDPALASAPEARSHLCAAKLCMEIVDTHEASQVARSDEADLPPELAFLAYASQFWTLHARKADAVTDASFEPPTKFTWCSDQSELVFKLSDKFHNTAFYTSKDDIPNRGHLRCCFDGGQCDAGSDVRDCRESLLVLLATEGCAALLRKHARACSRGVGCHGNRHVLDRAFFFAVHRGWRKAAGVVWDLAEQQQGIEMNVDMLHLEEYTPLYIACFRGKTELVEMLLGLGADPLVESEMGYELPLLAAVAQGYLGVVRMLVDRASNKEELLTRRNSVGWTVLHEAAEAGHVLVLEELLKILKACGLGRLVLEKSADDETAMDRAEGMIEDFREGCGPLSPVRLKSFQRIVDRLGELKSAIG
ncbi:Ankyrin-3 [Colletotrichum orbiculare MAFF 240422]|uniref:Ankyrin-3 n=1 Tax=Colletotrichum orbiculare (strain 104-T / ATCC 96160 / CBS 514.97 / LARS 414 / MAFF 240422) TaxID=1213857 RepID=N4VB62_COLOR|nr:Ankyrin-3 [Colletotrichum orbiculare MAFF 240422]